MFELDKDIKTVIIIVFHMRKKLSTDTEDINGLSQTSIDGTTICEMKNTLNGICRNWDIVEEKIKGLKDSNRDDLK